MLSLAHNEHDSTAVSGTESAPTTGRKSGPKQQIEVITRGERRRRWSREQKRAVVAESLEPGVSAITVARRHGISTGQLYTWRHQVRDEQYGDRGPGPAQFARVAVLAGPSMPAAPRSSQHHKPALINDVASAKRSQEIVSSFLYIKPSNASQALLFVVMVWRY